MAIDKCIEFGLVRHGCTKYNLEKRLQGSIDTALDSLGQEEACKLSATLQGQGWEIIISSDLLRAKETADILAKELSLPVFNFQLLRERKFGTLEGKRIEEITKEMLNADLPDKESVEDFERRITAAFNVMVNAFSSHKIIVVSHGGVIKRFLESTFQKKFLPIEHCSINNVIYKNGTWFEADN